MCRHVWVLKRNRLFGRHFACRNCGQPLVAYSWWRERVMPLTHVLVLEVPDRYLAEARQYEGQLYRVDQLPEGFAIYGSATWDWWLTYRSDGTVATACAREFFRRLPGGRWERYPFWDEVSPEQAWQEHLAGKFRVRRADPGQLAQYIGRSPTDEDAYRVSEVLRSRGHLVRLVRGGTDSLPALSDEEWRAIVSEALGAQGG